MTAMVLGVSVEVRDNSIIERDVDPAIWIEEGNDSTVRRCRDIDDLSLPRHI